MRFIKSLCFIHSGIDFNASLSLFPWQKVQREGEREREGRKREDRERGERERPGCW